jgi:hypothetical protein
MVQFSQVLLLNSVILIYSDSDLAKHHTQVCGVLPVHCLRNHKLGMFKAGRSLQMQLTARIAITLHNIDFRVHAVTIL